MEEFLVEEIKRAVIGIAEPPGGFDDLVQHRLQPARTGDGAQDATDGALLLAEILELARGVVVVAGRAGHGAQLRPRRRGSWQCRAVAVLPGTGSACSASSKNLPRPDDRGGERR